MRSERVPRLPTLGWYYLRSSVTHGEISAVIDSPARIWTTSGRAAIALALREAGLRHGELVLMPSFHCPTMVAPAAHQGLSVDYYPLLPSGSADLAFIEQRFRQGKVRALLAAHYFGFPQPIAEIRDLCDRYDVVLIEDCAHAMFGIADGRPIGSWGDYATASLTKFFPVFTGGCLVSHRRTLRIKPAPEFSWLAEARSLLDSIELGARHDRFRGAGIPLRMLFGAKRALRGSPAEVSLEPTSREQAGASYFGFDEAQAMVYPPRFVTRIALKADKKRIVERRRSVFATMSSALEGLDGIAPVHRLLPETVAPYVYPLLSERPDHVFQSMRRQGIPVFRWDWLWPGTPEIQNDTGVAWSRSLLQLPCHQDLTDSDVALIVSALRNASSS